MIKAYKSIGEKEAREIVNHLFRPMESYTMAKKIARELSTSKDFSVELLTTIKNYTNKRNKEAYKCSLSAKTFHTHFFITFHQTQGFAFQSIDVTEKENLPSLFYDLKAEGKRVFHCLGQITKRNGNARTIAFTFCEMKTYNELSYLVPYGLCLNTVSVLRKAMLTSAAKNGDSLVNWLIGQLQKLFWTNQEDKERFVEFLAFYIQFVMLQNRHEVYENDLSIEYDRLMRALQERDVSFIPVSRKTSAITNHVKQINKQELLRATKSIVVDKDITANYNTIVVKKKVAKELFGTINNAKSLYLKQPTGFTLPKNASRLDKKEVRHHTGAEVVSIRGNNDNYVFEVDWNTWIANVKKSQPKGFLK